MRELNVNEINQVNGGNPRVAQAVLGYIGSKIADGLGDLVRGGLGGHGNKSSGGQMNSERRSNMYK